MPAASTEATIALPTPSLALGVLGHSISWGHIRLGLNEVAILSQNMEGGPVVRVCCQGWYGLGVKGGFNPEKAHSPVPRGCELLSLGHTTQVLRLLKTTPP